jgi:hypothetical protein
LALSILAEPAGIVKHRFKCRCNKHLIFYFSGTICKNLRLL